MPSPQVKVNGQLTSSLTQQQIGLALRQTRPLRLTLARPVTGSSRSSAARGSQAPKGAKGAREAGKVLTFEAKEADERLGFKAGGSCGLDLLGLRSSICSMEFLKFKAAKNKKVQMPS